MQVAILWTYIRWLGKHYFLESYKEFPYFYIQTLVYKSLKKINAQKPHLKVPNRYFLSLNILTRRICLSPKEWKIACLGLRNASIFPRQPHLSQVSIITYMEPVFFQKLDSSPLPPGIAENYKDSLGYNYKHCFSESFI